MQPYFQDDLVTLYHGDCREVTEWTAADALLSDVPYGIDYQTNWARGEHGVRSAIQGDKDTTTRDQALALWGTEKPAIVFGSWQAPRPAGVHTLLIWDTLGALGMGDLSVPWKPSHQEMYVIGKGWQGKRTTDVYRCPPVQSTAKNGRLHPHEKPVKLLRDLLDKARTGWTIADPFAGSGSLAVAARLEGLRCILVEREESDCEVIARRLTLGDSAVKQRMDAPQLDLTGLAG